MRSLSTRQLNEILLLHMKHLNGDPEGRIADLSDVNLNGVSFKKAKLDGGWLRSAELKQTNFRGASLVAAMFRSAEGLLTCFQSADLSDADFQDASIRHAYFDEAVLRRANFCFADLRRSNFRAADLSGADFRKAELISVDFTDADLAGVNFKDADLYGANLVGSNLCDANLDGVSGLPKIEPLPGIRKKLLEAVTAKGCALLMSSWHTCETAHCLAGWTTTIHPQGKKLEWRLTCPTAAALILHASGESIPNFFDTDGGSEERAMQWLKTGEQ